MLDESVVHILGGGIGGTVGAVVTCPLEVVKVRLQSSKGSQLYKNCIPYQGSANTSANGETRSVKTTAVAYSPSSTKLTEKNNVILTARQRIPAVTHRLLFAATTSNPSYTSSHRNSLQSSATVSSICPSVSAPHDTNFMTTIAAAHNASSSTSADNRRYRGLRRLFLPRCISEIINTEGFRALFKGLLPTLVGVMPSRAIYFCSYHKGQAFFERHLTSGSSVVYLCAAGFGSVVASTLTNPIWFIKTQMQLDSRPGKPPISAGQVIHNTWASEGVRGFYRGVSASYVGSLETAVNFVLYENIKAELLGWVQRRRRLQQEKPNGQRPGHANNNSRHQRQQSGADLRGTRGGSKLNASSDMILCMLASAFSKFVAITAAYPHEVIRTRLREVHTDYRGFFSTLLRVAREEGPAALYRGMGTHYIRQVPNSCLMIGTYEAVVFLLQSWGLTKMNT